MPTNHDLDNALATAYETYCVGRPKSLAVSEEASIFMPGGNTRTVLYHDPFPFRASGGKGACLTDVDGHRLVNLLGEYTAGLFGHDHPVIGDAIREALSGGLNLGAHNLYEPRFARLLCERFPNVEMVRFTNSGTEANLMAITAARAHTGRSRILVFEGGYHGGVFMFKPGIGTNAPYDWIMVPYNDREAAVRAIRENADELAAVIVEPMLGSGGCIPGDADFLKALRRETEIAGALLIFDEVMTSRLGAAGAQGIHDLAPDLTTFGKWIGGGMSFGAFGGRRDIMDQFNPQRADAIGHAGTFNNNVLTMAAGIAALEQVYPAEKGVEFNAWGDGIRERLNAIAIEADVAVRASGMGSLICLHPTAGPVGNMAEAAAVDDRLRELLFLDLLEEGYYIARRGFIALSLALGERDMEGFMDAYRRVLVRRKAFYGG